MIYLSNLLIAVIVLCYLKLTTLQSTDIFNPLNCQQADNERLCIKFCSKDKIDTGYWLLDAG